MKAKDIILKAFERKAKGEKGLDVIGPSDDLSSGHIKKADHNLIVMTDLNKLGHEDWVSQAPASNVPPINILAIAFIFLQEAPTFKTLSPLLKT